MAAQTPVHAQGLRFTEWLFVLALFVAYLVTTSAPVFGVQLHHSFLNHAALVMLGPILLLHYIGVSMNRSTIHWSRILGVCLPFLLLALYALTGSAVAKWARGVEESYLAFGIYLMLLPLYVGLTADGLRLRRWAQVLIALTGLASLAALTGQALRFGTGATLHEIEYLVLGGFLTLYYAAGRTSTRLISLALLLTAAVLNQKLTGYIIAALALVHVFFGLGWRQLPKVWRGAYVVAAVMLTVTLAAVLTLLYFQFRSYLPSGNVEVRLIQYEQAMRQFINSPIWGNAYLEGSGEAFRESLRLINIPTHSDVLDLLKHGGLIAFGLFVWGYWKVLSLLHRAVGVTRPDHLLNAYFVGMRFFMVSALFTFAFNPLLLKGPFLVVIWANLGLAAGMAMAVLERQKASSA